MGRVSGTPIGETANLGDLVVAHAVFLHPFSCIQRRAALA
jgi:hypothetical protein